MFYRDHFILGRIIGTANIAADIDKYECGPEEIKIYRPQYDLNTGKFRGFHKIVGLIIVRGDDNETFFNYEFGKEKTKLLYSVQRRCIPKSLSGTLFNKNKYAIVNGEMKDEFSKFFFFLSSVTDRSEEVNQYLNNVSIRPVDIVQNNFKQWIDSGKDFEHII